MEAAKAVGRRVSLTGMLDFLGVSRSGYQAFLKHRPSEAELRKERVKERIREIYDGSHQNYGAPKITRELQKEKTHKIILHSDYYPDSDAEKRE